MSAAPAWWLALLAKAQRDKLTGFLTFSFRHGDIRHVKVEQVYFAPHEDGQRCPQGCGPMTSRDHGAMFVCESCGMKRTLAQLSQAARRDEP